MTRMQVSNLRMTALHYMCASFAGKTVPKFSGGIKKILDEIQVLGSIPTAALCCILEQDTLTPYSIG